MNIKNVRVNICDRMNHEREYLKRLQNIIDELQELSCLMSLDPKQQIKIEASLKRTEELHEEQFKFVNQIEKKVLKQNF